jgi:hypothetical protein
LFPDREVEAGTLAAVLRSQSNNLARSIQFLRGEAVGPVALHAAAAAPSFGPTYALTPMMQQPQQLMHAQQFGPPSYMQPYPPPPPSIHSVCPDRRLSEAQRRFFYEHGFLHLSSVVGPELVAAALHEINKGLGKGINVADYHKPKANPAAKLVHYSPDAWGHPSVTNLFAASALPTLVESLLGSGPPRSFALPTGGQIALTFPTEPPPGGVAAAAAWWNRPEHLAKNWHTDGIHRKANGFAADEIRNFTLLVGVYLSAAPADFCGNIAVFPGSHRQLEAHFRVEDPLVRLVDDEKPSCARNFNRPHQLHVQPGDVLLSHYQTAHTVAPNYGPNVRYAVYFRLTHSMRYSQTKLKGAAAHEAVAFNPQCMTHIWTEYRDPTMQNLAREEEEQRERTRSNAPQTGTSQAAATAATIAAVSMPPQQPAVTGPATAAAAPHLSAAAASNARRAAQAHEEAEIARALELSRLDY